MTTKKRKPLDTAMEEFVFGTQEATSVTTAAEVVSPPTTPPTTPPTPKAAEAAEAAEAIHISAKENSLMSKLQAPDKEATVRFTVDMSESLHRKLSMLAARTGRKKVDIVRMLLEDGLKDVEV